METFSAFSVNFRVCDRHLNRCKLLTFGDYLIYIHSNVSFTNATNPGSPSRHYTTLVECVEAHAQSSCDNEAAELAEYLISPSVPMSPKCRELLDTTTQPPVSGGFTIIQNIIGFSVQFIPFSQYRDCWCPDYVPSVFSFRPASKVLSEHTIDKTLFQGT